RRPRRSPLFPYTTLFRSRAEVEALGGRALVLPCDVADAAAVQEAADRVERELGPIDVWVNDAMTSVFSPFLEMKPEEFERVIREIGRASCRERVKNGGVD